MIECHLTSRYGDNRLNLVARLKPCSPDATLASVWVEPSRQFQSIQGFGGAFTESGATTWLQLDHESRKQVLRAYFDHANGNGYTFCRVHMNSCDFSLGNYAHLNTPDDLDLTTFSIERDRKALLPMIKGAIAMAQRPFKLLASPWSPPAWMKSNGAMNRGGKLLPEFAKVWAKCFVRFIQEYAMEGVHIWGVSVQNEPAASQSWDSCIYSAEEERDFVRDHLGPELHKAGLSHIKIVIWDHNRDLMVERAGTVYNDPEAAKYVWGTGFHWYGENHFHHVQLVHDAWPDKQLLFTEGCQEGGPHAGEWEVGERYGNSMIHDLNRWTTGWIDWNLVLDAGGGPNHVGNFCSAPILIDTASQTLQFQNSYYYMGHFSRFVKSGALRVLAAATKENLETTGFVNPDGAVVVVVMNRSESPIRFNLRVGAAAVVITELPARSIATYVSQR